MCQTSSLTAAQALAVAGAVTAARGSSAAAATPTTTKVTATLLGMSKPIAKRLAPLSAIPHTYKWDMTIREFVDQSMAKLAASTMPPSRLAIPGAASAFQPATASVSSVTPVAKPTINPNVGVPKTDVEFQVLKDNVARVEQILLSMRAKLDKYGKEEEEIVAEDGAGRKEQPQPGPSSSGGVAGVNAVEGSQQQHKTGQKRKTHDTERRTFVFPLRLNKTPGALLLKALTLRITHDEVKMANAYANFVGPMNMTTTMFPPGKIRLATTNTWARLELELVPYFSSLHKHELEEFDAYYSKDKPERAIVNFSMPPGFDYPYVVPEISSYRCVVIPKEPGGKRTQKEVNFPAVTLHHSDMFFVRYTMMIKTEEEEVPC